MSRTRRRLLPSHPSAPRHPCISGSLHLLQRRRRSLLLAEPRASAALASGTPEFASNRPIQADRLTVGARIRRNHGLRSGPIGDLGDSGPGSAERAGRRGVGLDPRRGGGGEKFSASRGVGGKSRCDRRPCISHPKLIQWLHMFYLSGLQIQTSNRPDIQTCSKPFRH